MKKVKYEILTAPALLSCVGAAAGHGSENSIVKGDGVSAKKVL